MKKSIIIISSLLIVAFVSGNVFARGQGKGQGMAQGYNQDCPRYGGQGYGRGWHHNNQILTEIISCFNLKRKTVPDRAFRSGTNLTQT